MMSEQLAKKTLKEKLFVIIFEADTRAGQLFDKTLIYLILLSLVVVVIDSVDSISSKFHFSLSVLEWLFTIIFSLEYIARVYCAQNRMQYVKSFYGIIDLIAVLPTYLAMLFPELHALIDVRVLRLIRIFRVFKLTEYVTEYVHLGAALAASRRKIFVFLSGVLMIVMVLGTLMYVIEGPANGFTSIPTSIYWAISTMTTVGFGDITPKTDLGRFITSIMMLMGWGTLAVPTGIVTAELASSRTEQITTRTCKECMSEGHGATDQYCRNCGAKLPDYIHD
ncbi:ion transporter [Polynucleobacter sp. MWH-CaK5]|jgi:voltage-gated potassium channel|uniref:ion transporter n=1 Tax=Polynucleobacter sp. MWH-CaK5 TaxID=2689107 RepID=UPI001BFDFAD4|nr:ion transporter [Polynucleobacter sp. MWH-CaK5]